MNVLVLGPERVRLVERELPGLLRSALASRKLDVGEVHTHCTDTERDGELAQFAHTTDLVILNSSVNERALDRLPELRRVLKVGGFRQGADVAGLAARGVAYRQIGDPAYVSVAEHALMLMFACARRLDESLIRVDDTRTADTPPPINTDQNERRLNWLSLDASTFRLLDGSSLGIIGLGEVGFEVATRARALGMDVVYNNRRRLDPSAEEAIGTRFAEKCDLVRESSFILLSCTVSLGAAPALSRADVEELRDDAIVVNIARGAAVDETALVDRARRSERGGLGLDVFNVEPFDPVGFAGSRNTYLTAHVASVLPEAARFQAIAAALDGMLRP